MFFISSLVDGSKTNGARGTTSREQLPQSSQPRGILQKSNSSACEEKAGTYMIDESNKINLHGTPTNDRKI